MAEVLLSDYLAHVFSEIARARDMADRYTKEIAVVYAKDEVLRHFSVPRFKLSKMDLTMPVLVSGVHLSSLIHFRMNRDEFRSFIGARVSDLLALVLAVKPGVKVNAGSRTEGLEPLIDVLHQELAIAEPAQAESVLTKHWSGIVAKGMEINNIPSELTKLKPVIEQISRALALLLESVIGMMVVSKATIEKLLVNPETNVVKDGSSGTSVFTLKAELIEEGVIVKRVKDETTGTESTVVEFE